MKRVESHVIACSLTLLAYVLCPLWSPAKADELSSILKQAAAQRMVALSYKEVKHPLFLKDSVTTSGRIFLSGDDFVMEQLQPKRILMTTDQHRFRFFISETHVYHSKMMSSPMIQKALKLFHPLLSGKTEALKQVFDVAFVEKQGRWTLSLSPKVRDAAFAQLRIQGKLHQAPSYAWIEMNNGDTVEWFFSLLPSSASHLQVMKQLMLESKGS